MKTKLLFSYFALLFAGLLVFSACSDDDKAEPLYLTMSSSTLAYDIPGGQKSFSVSTNMENWDVSVPTADQTWCEAWISGNSVFVDVAKTTEFNNRGTTITITGTSGNTTITKTAAVIQGALPAPTLSLSNYSILFTGTGAEIVTVTTNQEDWSYDIAYDANGSDWLDVTIEPSETAGEYYMQIEAIEDPTVDREAIVTVTAATLSLEISVSQGAAQSISFILPDFSGSNIYGIYDNDVKVAEVYLEFLKGTGVTNRAAVVYPLSGGKADYTQGVAVVLYGADGNPEAGTIHGGTVSFSGQTLTYTAGTSAAMTTAYMTLAYQPSGTPLSAAKKLTDLRPITVQDVCNNEYKIVKIGGQIWLAEHLRTTKWKDGTDIPVITDLSLAAKAHVADKASFAMYPRNNPSGEVRKYGMWYNQYAAMFGKAGNAGGNVTFADDVAAIKTEYGTWRVATGSSDNTNGVAPFKDLTDWGKVVTYVGSNDALMATITANNITGTNLSGLNLEGCGEIYDMKYVAPDYKATEYYSPSCYVWKGQSYNGNNYGGICFFEGAANNPTDPYAKNWNHSNNCINIQIGRAHV